MATSSTARALRTAIAETLSDLPVSVLLCGSGDEATSCLKTEKDAGRWPLLCAIDAQVGHPLECARSLQELAPLAHWLFLDVPRQSDLARELRSPVNRLGKYCSTLPSSALASIEPLVIRSLQRYRHQQQLSGINVQLTQTRRQTLSELQRFTQSPAFLTHLFETANEALIATATDGTLVMCNQAAKQLFGIDHGTAFNLNIGDIAKDQWQQQIPGILSQILKEASGHLTMELRGRTSKNTLMDLEVKLAQIREDNGSVIGLSFFVSDITARKQALAALEVLNKHLEQLCYNDGLTGIGNRRRFDLAMAQAWHEARRHHHAISVALIDLDYFKNYNDQLGHLAGDDCLRSVAKVLDNSISRSTDILARYGGEEFVLLLPHTSANQAERLVQICRQNLADARIAHPDSKVGPWLTVSTGIATTIPDSNDPSTLIELADRQLYLAKKAGRDCIRIDNRVHDEPASPASDPAAPPD